MLESHCDDRKVSGSFHSNRFWICHVGVLLLGWCLTPYCIKFNGRRRNSISLFFLDKKHFNTPLPQHSICNGSNSWVQRLLYSLAYRHLLPIPKSEFFLLADNDLNEYFSHKNVTTCTRFIFLLQESANIGSTHRIDTIREQVTHVSTLILETFRSLS